MIAFIRNILSKQIFKFIIVGGCCACLEFIIFNILIAYFGINYLIANVISIVIAVSINYMLSRAFVFEKSRYSKRNEFLSFALFSVLAIVLNQIILWFLFTVIHLDVRLAKALAIFLVASFNFITKKYIVFKA